MSRRTIYVGGINDIERALADRLVPGDLYPFGMDTEIEGVPEVSVMKWDLRRSMRRAHCTALQAFCYERAVWQVPLDKIAKDLGRDRKTVYDHIKAAARKLDALPPGEVGCFTAAIEITKSWAGLPNYIRHRADYQGHKK